MTYLKVYRIFIDVYKRADKGYFGKLGVLKGFCLKPFLNGEPSRRVLHRIFKRTLFSQSVGIIKDISMSNDWVLEATG